MSTLYRVSIDQVSVVVTAAHPLDAIDVARTHSNIGDPVEADEVRVVAIVREEDIVLRGMSRR